MLLALSALLTAGAGPPNRPALLSLDLLQLPAAGEQFDGFQIITHGIKALALCRKPPAWIVSYGNSNGSALQSLSLREAGGFAASTKPPPRWETM